MSKKIECRISCFPSGALLEGCFSGPGKRKMQFQYYSSWFHPDPLKLLKKSWRNTDFFLKIFRLPISSFLFRRILRILRILRNPSVEGIN